MFQMSHAQSLCLRTLSGVSILFPCSPSVPALADRVESGLDTSAIEAAGNHADAEERVKKERQVAFLNALGFTGLTCRLAALIRIRSGVVVTGPFINFLLHNHSINIKK